MLLAIGFGSPHVAVAHGTAQARCDEGARRRRDGGAEEMGAPSGVGPGSGRVAVRAPATATAAATRLTYAPSPTARRSPSWRSTPP